MFFEDIFEGDIVKWVQCLNFFQNEFILGVEVRYCIIDSFNKDTILNDLRFYFFDFIDKFDHAQFLLGKELELDKGDPEKKKFFLLLCSCYIFIVFL